VLDDRRSYALARGIDVDRGVNDLPSATGVILPVWSIVAGGEEAAIIAR
jgi:hypothetical protein